MAFNAQIPLSVRFLIDRAIQRHDARVMIFVISALAAGGVIVSAAGLMRDYRYSRVVAGIIAQLRAAMFARLQRLSLDYYTRTEGGDILSRFSNDLATVESGLSMAVSWGVQPALDILVSSVLVFVLDWRLALIGMALSPFVLIGPRLFAARTESLSDSKQEQEGRVVSAVQENIAAAAVVRAYGTQRHRARKFRGSESLPSRDDTQARHLSRVHGTLLQSWYSAAADCGDRDRRLYGVSGFRVRRNVCCVSDAVHDPQLFDRLSLAVQSGPVRGHRRAESRGATDRGRVENIRSTGAAAHPAFRSRHRVPEYGLQLHERGAQSG